MKPATTDDWRSLQFRQSVITKIDELVNSSSGMPTNKSSTELENQVYIKAKTKEEYMSLVARLVVHVRELDKKPAGMNPGNQSGQSNQNMQDPINALRTLAQHQGPGNQMMAQGGPQQGPPQVTASNLLQTLNQRPGPQNRMQGQINVSIGGNQPNLMNNPGAPGGPGGPIPISVNQMSGVASMMGGPGSMQMSNPGQMMGPGGPMGPHLGHLVRKGPDGMLIPGQPPNFMGGRGPVPQMYMRQPGPGSLPPPPQLQQQHSPASSAGHGGSMVPSPSLAQSPNPMMGAQRGPGNLAQSPASLNTPYGQPTPSPGSNEDQLYNEKIKNLTKYVEPLRRMIAQMGNDDKEKLSKMNKLLEILSTPGKRMPLDTLQRCEVVLEKLDFKRHLEGKTPSTQSVFKDNLLDAVNTCLQNPHANHTLHRTFGPVLEVMYGPPIASMPRPLKQRKLVDIPEDIPEVLQGEIARLDLRFKVSLDPKYQTGGKSIHLLCWLDDKHLPCVPPIQVTVSDDYPTTTPNCTVSNDEYNATDFLRTVAIAFKSRISNLPSKYSVSQLLDTWEMSVRQACSPDATFYTDETEFNALDL